MAAKEPNTRDYAADRATARDMYLVLGYTGREIAARLKVSETTISKWRTEGGWESLERADKMERELAAQLDKDMEEMMEYYMSLEPAVRLEKRASFMDSVLKYTKTRRALIGWVPIDHIKKALKDFLAGVARANPDLAKALVPEIDTHLRDINEVYRQ